MNGATAGIPIIDCDSHWTEPPDIWTSRTPRSMGEKMPHVEEIDGVQLWRVGDVRLGPIGLSVIQPSGRKVLGRLFLPHQSAIHAASWDPRARLEMLDTLGIDVQIVYPNVAGFASFRFLEVDGVGLRNACVEIYNDAFEIAMSNQTITLPITGMTCANCAATVERVLKKLAGVSDARVNFASEQAAVTFDPREAGLAQLVDQVRRAGYGVPTARIDLGISGMTWPTARPPSNGRSPKRSRASFRRP